ncbi:MAG: LicD family protein [Bacteroidales bacterium]|nr:LicD family protein [Bacteroidales bacterium]
MTELRHLQMVILDIMRDVDALCQENDIEYYLLGGSAIGAIRHKGFIPWDDDLDIIMNAENYERFLRVCKEKLDPAKYYVQEGLKDWPLYFSKIKLKGTCLTEIDGYASNEDAKGIFLDVFKMDNAPKERLAQYWQYICAKYFLCYQLSVRSYASATTKKKLMLLLSFPLRFAPLRNFVKKQVERYNKRKTDYWAFFYGRTRMKTSFVRRSVYGKPLRVPFEDMLLPVPEYYHEYLTQMFGDYMTPPPAEKQVGLHLINVDFGKY